MSGLVFWALIFIACFLWFLAINVTSDPPRNYRGLRESHPPAKMLMNDGIGSFETTDQETIAFIIGKGSWSNRILSAGVFAAAVSIVGICLSLGLGIVFSLFDIGQ